MAELRRQEIGLQQLYYSTYKDGEYSELKGMVGLNSAKLNNGGEGKELLRDGRTEFVMPSDEADTIEFAISQFTDDFMINHLGLMYEKGMWTEGGEKLPFYLVYFRKVIYADGKTGLKAEIYPSCTVIAYNMDDPKTDEPADWGFTARVDVSPNALSMSVPQNHYFAYSRDEKGGSEVVSALLDGQLVFPWSIAPTTTTTTTQRPTTTTTTTSTTTTTTTTLPPEGTDFYTEKYAVTPNRDTNKLYYTGASAIVDNTIYTVIERQGQMRIHTLNLDTKKAQIMTGNFGKMVMMENGGYVDNGSAFGHANGMVGVNNPKTGEVVLFVARMFNGEIAEVRIKDGVATLKMIHHVVYSSDVWVPINTLQLIGQSENTVTLSSLWSLKVDGTSGNVVFDVDLGSDVDKLTSSAKYKAMTWTLDLENIFHNAGLTDSLRQYWQETHPGSTDAEAEKGLAEEFNKTMGAQECKYYNERYYIQLFIGDYTGTTKQLILEYDGPNYTTTDRIMPTGRYWFKRSNRGVNVYDEPEGFDFRRSDGNMFIQHVVRHEAQNGLANDVSRDLVIVKTPGKFYPEVAPTTTTTTTSAKKV